MPSLYEYMFGSDWKKKSAMDKRQKEFYKNIFSQISPEGQLGEGYGQALQGLMSLMDPSSEAFDQFAAPYKAEFEQQIVPGLAERFAGAGAQGGALSSSGFGQALGAAGGQLEANLAGLKSGLMMQAMQDIMGQYGQMSGMGMGAQPFMYQKPQKGFLPTFFEKQWGADPYGGGGMGGYAKMMAMGG